jgi:nitric oxide reductase subunit B
VSTRYWYEPDFRYLGGVLGTGHHIYWVGRPGMWVPLGSVFSLIKVLPLGLLILDAIDYHDILQRQRQFR